MIDDIGSSGMNDWRREVLFDAIDQRYESTLPTVFTSNLSRKELSDSLGNRAASRLFAKENLIIEMHDQIDRRQV
jgi:DNA replication protein DnaC